jgi:pyruvate/2-oxoglutarate dehydrogenase complex dihydrolipoamide dehydrogenase (E3) component
MCNHDYETIQRAQTYNKTHFRLKITVDKKQKVITDVIVLGDNSTSGIKIFIVKKIIRNNKSKKYGFLQRFI